MGDKDDMTPDELLELQKEYHRQWGELPYSPPIKPIQSSGGEIDADERPLPGRLVRKTRGTGYRVIDDQIENKEAAKAKRKGWKNPRQAPMFRGGAANPKAKLTQEKVDEIRIRAGRDGISDQQLSKEYGVGATQIRRIIDGTRWPWSPFIAKQDWHRKRKQWKIKVGCSEVLDKAMALRAKGLNIDQICGKLGFKKTKLFRLIAEARDKNRGNEG